MHIAICDDNIVDRKQMERLLKREADRRRDSLLSLYVDSYGNTNALMNNPLEYDVYFIDFNSNGMTGIDIVGALISAGKQSVIYLCCGEIDYKSHSLPENVMFINKPIRPKELSEAISYVAQIIEAKEPTIEIREENGNYFRIKESELLYATYKSEHMTITMSEGRSATILSTFDHFYTQLQNYDSLIAVNGKTLINAKHIVRMHSFTVTMPGNVEFYISPLYRKYAKYINKVLSEQEK